MRTAQWGKVSDGRPLSQLAGRTLADSAQTVQVVKDISEMLVMDNLKKEIVYKLAMVLEKMGKKEEYLENLKLIYEVDYGYLDVAQRVESSYGS